jgi:hypothetical protein
MRGDGEKGEFREREIDLERKRRVKFNFIPPLPSLLPISDSLRTKQSGFPTKTEMLLILWLYY